MMAESTIMEPLIGAAYPTMAFHHEEEPERTTGEVIRCSSVRKVFGKRTVLCDVNLSIPAGEKFAILGPSGSGKSTLLRIMAGLETATSGRVILNGQPVEDIPAPKRRVGMVFQRSSVYPHMTVEENLGFPLRCRRVSHFEVARRVRELAELLGVTELLKQSAASLSGGESQRVAIGKALACPPTLLLLDEPFSNLDSDLRWRLLDEIKHIHERLRLTTVLVTHNIGEATYLADRVGILNGGSILQIAAPSALFDRPQSLQVARLLYSPLMNLIGGDLVSLSGARARVTPLNALPELYFSRERETQNERVAISWRPSDATVVPEMSNAPVSTERYWVLAAEVSHIAIWEGRRLATLTASDTTLRVPTPYSSTISCGQRVHVVVPKTSIVVFSAGDSRLLPLRAETSA
jgi:ABC-type sugar transport system ATPase subunit